MSDDKCSTNQSTVRNDECTANLTSGKPTSTVMPIKVSINGMHYAKLPPPPPPVNLDPNNFKSIIKKSHKAIKDNNAIRIIAAIPLRFLDWADFLASATSIITPFITAWTMSSDPNPSAHQSNKVHFIAVAVQSGRSYAAIEINNHAYDFKRAHEQDLLLPVYVLRLSRTTSEGRGRWKFYRCPAQDERVMEDLKDAHHKHGWEMTPFLDVRLNPLFPPIYGPPRC